MKRCKNFALIGVVLFALLVQGRATAQNPAAGLGASFGVPQVLDRPVSNVANPAFTLGVPSFPMQETTPPCVTPTRQIDSRRTPLAVFWDNGLRFESENEQFHLHLGGSAQIDSTWLIGPQSVFLLPNGSSNGVGNAAATFLRRARLRAVGSAA